MALVLTPLKKTRSKAPLEARELTGVILAGGLGTRLRSVLGNRPKVLAPIGSRPFVTRLLLQLAQTGIERTVLLIGHGGKQVREELGDSHAGMGLDYSEETHPLGTAGALRLAVSRIETPHLLLMNGDSYCGIDLRRFTAFHARRSADLSIVLVQAADARRFGQVEAQADGTIIRFSEKGTCGPGWINAGIYMFRRDFVFEIPRDRAVSLEQEVIPAAVFRKRVVGFKTPAPFVDIGTPESYAEAAAFFERGA
jgi:D-glycero-alpha-D-manno-heptose 1-phosphate guanylyltransferase